jgi:hypothetical protein
LRKCAINEYDDRWVDAEAIQTPKLMASPRSREILDEALRVDQERSRLLAQAEEYVAARTRAAGSSDLETLAAKVREVIKDWELGWGSKITL